MELLGPKGTISGLVAVSFKALCYIQDYFRAAAISPYIDQSIDRKGIDILKVVFAWLILVDTVLRCQSIKC